MSERGGSPSSIADAVNSFLSESGLGDRIQQARVVTEWASIVGEQIAAATHPRGVTSDGTLLVGVRNNAWMNELSLREPEILRKLRSDVPETRVQRIRWQIWIG